MDNTSIGQPAPPPKPGDDRATQATTEGVDAQNANEFDSRHGLAGAAKPSGASGPQARTDEDKSPPRTDKPKAPGLVAERRSAGADNPTADGGDRKSGRDDTLDEDLDRERRQPGLNANGKGGVGADPAGHHEDSNSNT